MNYKVGDTVVCIDAQGTYLGPNGLPPLVLGAEYQVLWMNDRCASVETMPADIIPTGCVHCGQRDGFIHDHQWRFIKLDGLVQEQGEYEGALA